jgi:hypothetical protein
MAMAESSRTMDDGESGMGMGCQMVLSGNGSEMDMGCLLERLHCLSHCGKHCWLELNCWQKYNP